MPCVLGAGVLSPEILILEGVQSVKALLLQLGDFGRREPRLVLGR